MRTASYTKLRSGDWGVRVTGDVKPGDRLMVTNRSMKARSEQIDKVIWRGDDVTLCSLVPRSPRKRPRRSRSHGKPQH